MTAQPRPRTNNARRVAQPSQQQQPPQQQQRPPSAPANDEGGGNLVRLLEKMRPQIASALPKHISPDRIARIALTALRTNSKLAACTPGSFLGSLLQASQLGLEVNTPLGHAYLIPFEERKSNTTLAQLVIGYQGMLDLARRSGMVRSIYAHAVHEGDVFEYEYGLEPKLIHRPAQRHGNAKPVLTHVYAVARLKEGEPVFTALTRWEVEQYRARSRAANSGPWTTDYDAMAMKTAIRRLYRWLPKSAEEARAVAIDEAPEYEGRQIDHFSPEIRGILDTLPETETGATPEVQQRQPPKRGAALDVLADTMASEPEPATNEPTAAEVHAALAAAEKEWLPGHLIATINQWTAEQRAEAFAWATAMRDESVPDDELPPRPAWTVLERQPGEDG